MNFAAKRIGRLGWVASAAIGLAARQGARDPDVTVSPSLPASFRSPEARFVTGTVAQNVAGSPLGQPAASGPRAAEDATGWRTTLAPGASAIFDFRRPRKGLSFVWGAPSRHHNVYAQLVERGIVLALNGAQIFASDPDDAQALHVTASGLVFDRLVFAAGPAGFDFANLEAAPLSLPAQLWLTMGGAARA